MDAFTLAGYFAITTQVEFCLLFCVDSFVRFLHKCSCGCYKHGYICRWIFITSSSVPSPGREDCDEARFCYADELTLLVPSADG